MFLLDVNVVLAAHRGDHPHPTTVRPWFDQVLAGDDPFSVPVLVWASFLRLATNRRIFEVPSPRAAAFAFIEGTCAQPHHVSLGPGPRHLTCCVSCATRPTRPATWYLMRCWPPSLPSTPARW